MGLYRYLSLMTYLFKSVTFENAHPQSQRLTNNQQPTTNNQQPTTNNQQPTTNNTPKGVQ